MPSLNLNMYTFLLNNECACRISFGDLVLSSQLTLTYQALLVRYDEQNIIILLEVEPIKSGYGLWTQQYLTTNQAEELKITESLPH